MTERLVSLETADIDVPPPPGVGFRPPLYFRVRSVAATSLRIELWELGRPHGARNVSSAGTLALEARRIALAAAELARTLRKRRIAEIAALEDEDGPARTPSGGNARVPLYARFVWSAGARAAALPAADTFFVGPQVDVALAFDGGQRLSLGGAWLGGAASDEPARWLELRLAASQEFALSHAMALSVGVDSAVASLKLARASDGGTSDDVGASARAGVFSRLTLRAGPALILGIGPDVGVILAPRTLERANGSERFGGLWLGGSLTLSVDRLP
jgi:hypothetical protein